MSVGGVLRRLAPMLGVATALAAAPPATAAPDVSVQALRLVDADSPLGVDLQHPRLAWQLHAAQRGTAQSAYELHVGTTADSATSDTPDVWDSGKVLGSESAGVPYAGPALQSSTRYFWSVRVWDQSGQVSGWAPASTWETGLMSAADWGNAAWISAPRAASFSDFRLDIDLTVTRLTAGVWFRSSGADGSGYMWQLRDNGTSAPTLRPHRVVNGTYTLIKEIPIGTVIAPGQLLNRPHRLSIEADGATIRSYIDGGLVDTMTDATFSSGQVGFRQSGTGEAATFDRVTVKTLGGMTLFDDDFSGAASGWSGGTQANGVLTVTNAQPFPLSANPQFRRGLAVAKPVARARAYVAGLGYYQLFVNGRRIGDHELDPGWTDYTSRSLYATYDVTDALRQGPNAIAASLGDGFFVGMSRGWGATGAWDGVRRLKLRLLVDYADGTSSTLTTGDGGWKVSSGPMRWGQVTPDYETYDARAATPGWTEASFDDTNWAAALPITPPAGSALDAQLSEPVRVKGTYTATRIAQLGPTRYLYTFPKNISGRPRLTVQGPAGTSVTLRLAEKLRSDGTVDIASRNQTVTYTLAGTGTETYAPEFSYYGFQYVQVDGYPGTPDSASVVAEQLYNDVAATGAFSSQNTLLNTLHEMVRLTTLNNHVGVPTDGAMVEKLPWTGDAGLMTDSAFRNFDLQRFYVQWLGTIRDSQDATGNVADWAPQPTTTQPRRSAIWGDQYVSTAWDLYRYYGNRAVLAEFYDSLKRYVAFETGRLSAAKISTEQWGDWVTPAAHNTVGDRNLVGTAYVIRSVQLMQQIATVVGNSTDASSYASLASSLRDAFNTNYFDPAMNVYRAAAGESYLQTPSVLALAFGLVPAGREQAVADRLAADVVSRGDHLNTGVTGTKYLLPMLSDHGYTDLAFRVATQTTAPSWGFWVASGSTTLWEEWRSASRSKGHWFLGTVDDWLHGHLAGISVDAAGYSKITIKPYLPAGLEEAQGSIDTVRGTVASRWQRDSIGRVDLHVTVPANSTATVYVPARSPDLVAESGVPAATASGVDYVGFENGYAIYRVGSGGYRFRSNEAVANGDVGGSVPATLSLSLGTPASFGTFAPGVDRTYDAGTTANVVSTAGEATLSISDPSSTATGRLVNGAFALDEPLHVRAASAAGVGGAFAPLRATASDPLTLLTFSAPVSNDQVTFALRQHVGAKQPLRTGGYAKTLTITLSTSTP